MTRIIFTISLVLVTGKKRDSILNIKETTKLYHKVTNNIRKNKIQHNDAIENNLKFDNKFSLPIGTKDPLPVVTVVLRGDKNRGQ